MAGTSLSQNELIPFQQLLGYNKGILEKWVSLEDCIYSSDTFSAELREQVRHTLVFHNGCKYCVVRGVPLKSGIDPWVQPTVHAADLSGSRAHISDNETSALKEVFIDGEIAELLALICFIMACQRLGTLPGLETNCQI